MAGDPSLNLIGSRRPGFLTKPWAAIILWQDVELEESPGTSCRPPLVGRPRAGARVKPVLTVKESPRERLHFQIAKPVSTRGRYTIQADGAM